MYGSLYNNKYAELEFCICILCKLQFNVDRIQMILHVPVVHFVVVIS